MTRTILCFGDSNTHGTLPLEALGDSRRLGPRERWPGVLRAALGEGVTVIEEGLPGRTTVHDDPVEGAYRNGMTGLQIALHTHKPIDLMILMLGTNDLKMRFSKPASDIVLSIQRLIGIAKASACGPDGIAPAILLVSPPPILETGVLATMFTGGARKSLELASGYSAIARAQGCGFVDAGQHVASSPVDGIHFDAAQHAALGAAIAATLSSFRET